MKLAEALVERKAAQLKISQLNERLQRVVLIQEGVELPEEPQALLSELGEVCAQLEWLITAINHTNLQAKLPDGRSITDAIAARDVLRMRLGVLDTLIRTLGTQHQRARGSEIRIVATINPATIQRERDTLAKQYRELDTAIQSVNWNAELVNS